MARFVVPVTIELQIEADSVWEAFHKFNQWRKFIMAPLSGRLEEAGIHRIKIEPSREYTEVNDTWQDNHRLRRKFQQDWEYETRLEPVVPGSKLMLTHRVAVGPKKSQPDQQEKLDDDLRPEYDEETLRGLIKSGVRGKYVERSSQGTSVKLDPDVAALFPTGREVSDALRRLAADDKLAD